MLCECITISNSSLVLRDYKTKDTWVFPIGFENNKNFLRLGEEINLGKIDSTTQALVTIIQLNNEDVNYYGMLNLSIKSFEDDTLTDNDCQLILEAI